MRQEYDEARRRFEAAARELVEANKRARASGLRVTDEMHAAVRLLGDAQERLKQADAARNRQFEPVALSETVIKKIDQTFAPQDRREVKDLLVSECGRNLPFKSKATSRSLDQIRLAVIKVASGNLDELRRHIGTAKSDWREVIGAAENPEAMRFGLVEFYNLDEESRAAIAGRDRQQYLDWLNAIQ